MNIQKLSAKKHTDQPILKDICRSFRWFAEKSGYRPGSFQHPRSYFGRRTDGQFQYQIGRRNNEIFLTKR